MPTGQDEPCSEPFHVMVKLVPASITSQGSGSVILIVAPSEQGGIISKLFTISPTAFPFASTVV